MHPATQTILTFLLMGVLCAVLERLWPQEPDAPRWRNDSSTDVLYNLLRLFLSVMLALATGFAGTTLPAQASTLSDSLPFGVQLLVVLFLSDFIQYWIHLLMHHFKPLWHIHAVHHSPVQIDWLIAARVHPFELGINKAISSAPLYFLGFSPNVFAVSVPLAAAYSLLIHSNLSWTYGPFGYIVTSPAFHRWHHSSDPLARDKNFA
jgi:sterol desaturase/sphingolipid hydroxylase (fatty acid hydroxylase superfamily)